MIDIVRWIVRYPRLTLLSLQLRHVSLWKTSYLWLKNRHIQYRVINCAELLRHKTSDTIFVLASGPSLLEITTEQKAIIAEHDSFGVNFSFLSGMLTTFHQVEYGRLQWEREYWSRLLAPWREMLSDTIWFQSYRGTMRLTTPRLTPDLYPARTTLYRYHWERPIQLERNRPFTDSDFERAIQYRGSFSLALSHAVKMGYRNIVMIGVDLHTPKHFFWDMPQMKDYIRLQTETYGETHKLRTMMPKGNKYRPFDEYLYALNDYLIRRGKGRLFVATEKSMLYPRLPCYWSEGAKH